MIYRCGSPVTDRSRCGCGDDCGMVTDLTPEEFKVVARAFIERLNSEMARAGCNDVFLEEFPQSVCDRFDTDFGVLAAFAAALEWTGSSCPGRDVFDGGLGSAY